MKKYVELSRQPNNHIRHISTRVAVIEMYNKIDRSEFKKFETSGAKDTDVLPQNVYRPVVNEIAILDEHYVENATVLTANDWAAINKAIQDGFDELSKERVTLEQYYE